VVLHAREGDPRPGDGHDALHHAHGEALFFEDGSLLDVELEIGAEGTGDAGLGAQVADALELVAEAQAVPVARIVRVLERDLARHHARADHGRLEACALFIGEDGHGHGMPRLDLPVVQRSNGLEGAQHPELPVVLASGGDGVGVRAHQDGGPAVTTRALAKDVAHLVNGDGEPGLAHPAHEQIAPPPIVIGEGDAVQAALGGGPDATERLHALFEPLAIDAHGPSGPRVRDTPS
jgi:hypothetical protein